MISTQSSTVALMATNACMLYVSTDLRRSSQVVLLQVNGYWWTLSLGDVNCLNPI